MKFNFNFPLENLPELQTNIWDSHVHIWDANDIKDFFECSSLFGIKKIMGIAQPEVKETLEERGESSGIIFAYYLPMNGFAQKDLNTILEAIDEAKRYGYTIVKVWFGPRFLDYYKAKFPFSIADPIFNPVYSKIEDYKMSLDIHVADPDTWYTTKYLAKHYRTKTEAIEEFNSVMDEHPSMKVLSVHFGSLPEINNLERLANMFDSYSNLYIDTASTKWMIRELGYNPSISREFIIKYQKRILFATDLSAGYSKRTLDYFSSRYWSQRLFWETSAKNIELPFKDDDSNGKIYINGLNLPKSVLSRLYWKNAEEFFRR